MKRLFSMLVMLFVLYFFIQVLFNVFGTGNEVEYQLVNDYEFVVSEKSTFKLKNSLDNYYFNVSVEGSEFKFQVFNNFYKKQHVIKDIKYFSNGVYKCILPIFLNKTILIDGICENNGMYEYASSIKNSEINKFLTGVDGYDISKFQGAAKEEKISNFMINSNSLFDKHYISLSNYRGISVISKEFNRTVRDVKIFEKDVYKQELATYVDKYYLVADYNENYQFNKFYLVDITKLEKEEITSSSKISFDSYIQGVVLDKVYLYDKEKTKQYEINVSSKTITEVGNASNGIIYYDGEWKKITVAEANNNKLFKNNTSLNDPTFSRIDAVGSDVGYYYLYKKNNDKYQVYRGNVQDDRLIYLFDTETIDSIIYFNTSMYYIDGNKLKTYSDEYGNVTILTYDELNFNKSIKFNIYKDR